MNHFEKMSITGMFGLLLWPSSARADVGALQFDEPASSLEDSYSGRYGKRQNKVEGPFVEAEQNDTAPARVPDEPEAASGPFATSYAVGLAFTGGLGLNASYTYLYNRYIGTQYELTYALDQQEKDGVVRRSEVYGPGLTFLFQLANPSFLTPIAGVGPSIEFWRRQVDAEELDQNHSVVGSSLVGANLKLSRYFKFQIAWASKSYLFARPKAWQTLPNNSPYMAKTQNGPQVRFLLHF